MSLIAIIFSRSLSIQAFKTDAYWQAFCIYGCLLIFSSFNSLGIAVLNGDGQIRRMTLMSIISSIVNLLCVIVLAHYFKLTGILIASSVSASVSFLGYVYHARRLPWLHQLKPAAFKPDWSQARLLLGFTVMNLTSGLLAPSLQLIIRTRLITGIDASSAGMWQANTRLSDYYLNFIYTVMGIYYLPKLSQLQERVEIRREIRLGYLRILPAVAVLTTGIFLFKSWIVATFLSKDFLPVIPLIKWQLLGDFMKIASWLLAYLMVAKAMKKTFIATEIIFSSIYVVLSVLSVQYFGMVGPVYAFLVNYTLYFITMFVIMRKYVL